jgi:excisionase family DNA binding protein
VDIITTRQVADLLAVSEATVKRWADAGTLKCFRTPGGHRKFRMADIAEFLQHHRYEPAGPVAPVVSTVPSTPETKSMTPSPVVLPDDRAVGGTDGEVVMKFRNLALAGDTDSLVSLMAQQRLKGHSLSAIFDGIATPALADIGERWARGALTIAQEHIAAQTVIESLARIKALIERPSMQRGRVLFAAPGDEQHDIALRMGSILAYGLGFTPVLLGARCPVADLSMMIAAERPVAVVLSFSGTQPIERIREELNTIVVATRGGSTRLFIGGSGAAMIDPLPSHVVRTSTLTELAHAMLGPSSEGR